MKKILLLTFILFSFVSVYSQNYGNEWINFGQDYYKIKIGREGIYRIGYTELKNAGFPSSSVSSSNIQIWINGNELPILVNDGGDNSFDSSDYIEFYGKQNDGVLDAPLFPNPAEQPHQYMSLYTDTSIYYLTIGNTAGKRVSVFEDRDYSGKTTDPYFFYQETIWYNNKNKGQSYDGFGFAKEGFNSEFNEGEGWALQFSGSGTKISFLSPFLSPLGPRPYLEALVHSRANNISAYDIDGYNNGIELTYDPSNVLISSKRVKGYGRYLFQDSLSAAYIGSKTTGFKFTSFLLSKSIHSLAYAKLVYPRLFNLNDSSRFKFIYNSGNPFLKFSKYPSGKNAPLVYDTKNFIKSIAEVQSGTLYCNLSNAFTNREIYIVDETQVINLNNTHVEKYRFNELRLLSAQDYLIITHQSLDSGANAYKNFLATSTGGGHNAYIAHTDDIYNQFYYGLKHPTALKNFCRYAINNTSSLKYLLLLGKGQKYINTRFNPVVNYDFDLVPTYGLPPTDYYFVTGYNGSKLDPLLAIGRLPASRNNQIASYLSKMEEYISNSNAVWKKRVLQLAGGNNTSEVEQFVGYHNTFFNLMKQPLWAVNRKIITKQDPSPIDSSLKTKIQNEINLGYAMIDYFGHGSTQASDIDLGDAYQLSNSKKYPFYYFNGCGLGNTFDGGSLAEDYLFTPNKGAIGWMAGTTFGYIGELYYYALEFHKNLTQKTNLSFAENINQTITNYQIPNNDYNKAQCQQMLYMGDPSIRIFYASNPDYTANADKSKILPEKVTADADSFGIRIQLLNIALATNDSFTIKVNQTLPNGSTISHPSVIHPPVYNNDSVVYWIHRDENTNINGLNTFQIILDSANTVTEQSPLGETNNISQFQYNFSSSNAQILFPLQNSIISGTTVELTAQSLVFKQSNFDFVFELDTVPTFDSPFKQNSGNIVSTFLAKTTFPLLSIDSIDYYWRVRILDATGKGVWDVSTFSRIHKSPSGWSQGYYQKFVESQKENLVFDSLRTLQFITTQSLPYVIETSGKASSATWRTIWHEGYPLYFGYITSSGILAVAINPKDETRFCMNSKYNVTSNKSPWWGAPSNYLKPYFEVPGSSKSCSYLFNTNNKTDRDSFLYFLQKIPKDYTLMFLTGPNHNIPNWEDTIFRELEKFGAVLTKTVKEEEPYILVGKKGQLPGTAIEKLSDPTNPLPGRDQYIFINTTLNILADSGHLSSSLIGPAKSWKYFYRTLLPKDTDFDLVKFDIVGYNSNGTPVLLKNDVTAREISLSDVDALDFPYIRIIADIEDSINKTPTGIARWTVLYEGFPEGAINPITSLYQNKDTLDEGDTLIVKLAYKNISELDMDSMLVLITSTDAFNKIDTLEFAKYKNLKSYEEFIIDKHIGTRGLKGGYLLNISINPNMAQPEQYLFNNNWQFHYFIKTDKTKPYLDVVFDGRHITNLEIISPNPVISMTAADNNNFLYLDNAEYYTVKIKYPGTNVYRELDVLSDSFEFFPSTGPNEKCRLEYKPLHLPDGVYELAVSIKDANGNLASAEDYTISFKIVSKSTITNVYPYPNPFTTKTKFVFTLTGERVPDVLKISIMTISGIVVKEINMEELGPLRIGNNITTYEWNGTDQYGDKLANGVYLYKVTARLNGKEIELGESSGDSFFKKGIGKMYIMR